jgi:serine/threonine-protein kinase
MKLQANLDVLNWFDNFNRVAPTWYVQYSHIHIQYIDGVPFKLKAPFDFSFLRKYGEVFKVFDGQDSGNICFGVANGAKRYFVKFAGAPTSAYTGAVESAIERLKAAVPLYLELAHPALIRFVSAEEIGGGYAMVFDWVDAICAHRMYPADYKAFGQLPLDVKRRIFEDIMEFHAYITEKGYIAVDLYDGSVMYDLTNGRTVICDIDFFVKANYIYNIGPLWGCTRFMAPEDFQTGAVINEVTNVYGLGAMAFALFADSDRSPEAWPLTQELYAVVRRATSDERAERQQSIRQLIDEWKAAEQSMFNPAPGRALR